MLTGGTAGGMPAMGAGGMPAMPGTVNSMPMPPPPPVAGSS
jgi:hypothetical protein